MRPFALALVVIAVAAIVAAPGRASEEAGDGVAGAAASAPATMTVCEGGDCSNPTTLAVTAAQRSEAADPRLDDRTRDLLVIAALVCLLLASFLLNARAFGRGERRPRTASGRRSVRPGAPPAAAPAPSSSSGDHHTPVSP